MARDDGRDVRPPFLPFRDVRAYGTRGDGVTDDTAAIQAAINAAYTAGGGMVVLPSGKHVITSALTLKKGVGLIAARPQYASATVDEVGSWLVWTPASAGTMLHVGTATQTESASNILVQGIGFDAKSRSDVTCISLRSNTATSPVYVTSACTFRHLVIAKAGIGVQWGGNGLSGEQSDFIKFEQCDFYNLATAAVRVNGTNCGDASTFDTCRFSTCSAAGDPYIDLIVSGYLTFLNCSAGGDGTNGRDFVKRQSNSNRIKLIACQSEGMRYFVRHIGNDYANPVELHGCIVDDAISIEASGRVVSYGSHLRDLVAVSTGGRYDGYGDNIDHGSGGRIAVTGSGVYTNRRTKPDTVNTYYAAGDRITELPGTGLFGTAERYAVRSGFNAAAWVANTAYSGNIERSWVASTAYVVGDKVTPTYGNGMRYRCTVAGTSGATEPTWKKVGTNTYTDGTCSWVLDGVATRTVAATSYVQPTTPNAHFYKLITAGTSHATTEPTWPTTSGATVTDGTCTWQETGQSPVVRGIPLVFGDSGGAIPVSGYFERGHIRWNNGPDASEFIGWVCTVAGNPGTWKTFGAISA